MESTDNIFQRLIESTNLCDFIDKTSLIDKDEILLGHGFYPLKELT